MARLYILGAGTPTPTAQRFGSSYVVEVGGEYLMFDCGPATTHKLVQAGLRPTQIDYFSLPTTISTMTSTTPAFCSAAGTRAPARSASSRFSALG